ncbi:hypothetical protein AGMMS49991_07820 [Spirochaetia bacterium]|nr:hypothetical protein AGMMS49991_07820 [Spirochaetia bacterium]
MPKFTSKADVIYPSEEAVVSHLLSEGATIAKDYNNAFEAKVAAMSDDVLLAMHNKNRAAVGLPSQTLEEFNR